MLPHGAGAYSALCFDGVGIVASVALGWEVCCKVNEFLDFCEASGVVDAKVSRAIGTDAYDGTVRLATSLLLC